MKALENIKFKVEAMIEFYEDSVTRNSLTAKDNVYALADFTEGCARVRAYKHVLEFINEAEKEHNE